MTLPKTVRHRYTGETVTFLQSGKNTNGELLHIEVSLPSKGDGPPLHVHDEFEERFEVMEGQLTVFIADRKLVLKQGETIVAPLNCAHTFTNEHAEPVTFHVWLTPASGFEQSMRIHYGLMDDGLTNDKGVPKNPLHLAYILKLQNTFMAGKSLKYQRLIYKGLMKLGEKTKSFEQLKKYYES